MKDEDADGLLRKMEAQSSANRYLAEVALLGVLRLTPAAERRDLIAAFRSALKQTDHLRAADEHDAEWTADVFVQMQTIVEESLKKVSAVLGIE